MFSKNNIKFTFSNIQQYNILEPQNFSRAGDNNWVFTHLVVTVQLIAFSALTLLVGRQEEHLAP